MAKLEDRRGGADYSRVCLCDEVKALRRRLDKRRRVRFSRRITYL